MGARARLDLADDAALLVRPAILAWI